MNVFLRKFIIFLFYLLITAASSVRAQENTSVKDARRKNLFKQLDDYKKADKIADEAKKQLERGQIKQADSLIKQSIAVYPTKTALDFAELVARLPDMVGANNIIYGVLDRIKAIPEDTIIVEVPGTIQNIGGVIYQRHFEKGKLGRLDVLYMMAGGSAYRIERNFGSKADFAKLLNYILSIENNGKGDPGISGVYRTIAEIGNYRLQSQFDEAIKVARAAKRPQNEIISLTFEKGAYQEVIRMIGTRDDDFANAILFTTYARLGDNNNAQRYYEVLTKRNRAAVKNVELIYYQSLLAISTGDYSKAVSNLKGLLADRKQIFSNGNTSWTIYTALGRAYAGLKDYGKAKDNLNIALLYNPEYEEAIDALGRLEGANAQTIAEDKTGPVITLTEQASRGNTIITTASTIMLKGNAADASGLQEITFNGKNIFFQSGGSFWGEIDLKDGFNDVKILAKDNAGNSSALNIKIEKNAKEMRDQVAIVPVTEKTGKNYCLLIAVQNYTDDDIPSLANPIADAVRLKLILKNNYNFEDDNIISLYNPGANDLKRQFLELTNIIQPEDNLLIFYAGHGIWVDKEKKGYWLLTDAKRSDANTWLPNKAVLDLIAKLSDRHTLLITDACFSGSVFKTRGIEPTSSVTAKKMEDKICRVAITSGNDTVVPDESVFMKYLLKALQNNKEKYLIAQKMFINQILEAVMSESKTEPRYGTLEQAGHVGGDFVFTQK